MSGGREKCPRTLFLRDVRTEPPCAQRGASVAQILLSERVDGQVHWRRSRTRATIPASRASRSDPLCGETHAQALFHIRCRIGRIAAVDWRLGSNVHSHARSGIRIGQQQRRCGYQSGADDERYGRRHDARRPRGGHCRQRGGRRCASRHRGNAIARDDRAGKPAPADGTVPANSTTTSHKSRGNAHWQSLLPGLMR